MRRANLSLTMQLNAATSNLLIIWYLLGSVLNIGLLAALVVILGKLNSRIVQLEAKVDPALRQSEALLTEANARLTAVGDSAERLLSQSEAITARVETGASTTVSLVQRAVYLPFVHANALIAAVFQSASTFGSLQRQRRSLGPNSDSERIP
jgi:hypothetical protein